LITYKEPWPKGWRCVIPAECVFEPCWEMGVSVRWRIQQPGEVPMGIAGVFRRSKHPTTGEPMWSFSMLTVNADGHLSSSACTGPPTRSAWL
jgi:putative SOS response-associated peptidase YedK